MRADEGCPLFTAEHFRDSYPRYGLSQAKSETPSLLKADCLSFGVAELQGLHEACWRERKFSSEVLTAFFVLVVIASASRAAENRVPVKGRVLEACSCMVPCPCNFGRAPAPKDICDSLAVFEFEGGEVDGIALKGLRFALASRGGTRAILYRDVGLSETEHKVLRKVATWILSLEGTPLVADLEAPIRLQFHGSQLSGFVGDDSRLTVVLLRGNDGESPMVVSHPWMFGRFPIIRAHKGVAQELRVRGPGLLFDYTNSNANDAIFEFPATDVR